MDKKIKLIFFDMEGNVFETGIKEYGARTAASVWTVIARNLGKNATAEEQVTKDKWNVGKYKNYIEWMEETIEIHKKHGLKMNTFYNIIHKIPYVPGAKKTFEELRKRGYKTAIISGGFKNQANRALRDLKIDHVFAACEYFFDDKSKKLSHWNLLPCDYEGKVDFLRLMMREYGLHPQQCAFIGDGVNDIPLAQEVGTSIAFNAREELQKVCTHVIDQKQKNLKAILKYFP